MENIENTTPNPIPQVSPPAQNTQPAPSSSEIPVKKSSNLMLYVLILIAILVLIGGSGFMMIKNINSSLEPAAVTPQPTEQITPTPSVVSEETEVDNVTVDDPASDFTDVDKDLQGL